MQTEPSSDDPISEMVAATGAPFHLEDGVKQITLTVKSPTNPEIVRKTFVQREAFLLIEHIKCDSHAPEYSVYLNVPPGGDPEKHPELHIGDLSMFGLKEASRPNPRHPDNGLTYTLEITDLYRHFSVLPGWDAKNLRVSFVAHSWLMFSSKITVGRVSLYLQ